MARLIACLALSFAALPAHAEKAPKLPAANFEQLAKPLPMPFDPKMDAGRQIELARARAKRENKLLLLELGANWCPFCRNYAGTMALPAMRKFADRHFVSLAIDIGKFDRNVWITEHYGLGDLPGIPVLLVIDPADDRLLNEGEVSLFAHLPAKPKPQDIANFVARWAE